MALEIRHVETESEVEIAARVLARAFLSYPLMTRVFASASVPLEEAIRGMFRITLGYRWATGLPIPVAVQHGEIVGVVKFKVPDAPAWPTEFEQQWDEFEKRVIGPNGIQLFADYMEVAKRANFPQNHLFVVALGIDPGCMRSGAGRALLEHVSEVARRAGHEGVGLFTEDPDNVPYYLDRGFEITGSAPLRDMTVWQFWKPV